MTTRSFLFFLIALSSRAQSIAVTSPANGAVITGTVQLQATISGAPATEHVDWYVNGDLYASSHLFNGPCGSYENCPGPGFSAQYVTTDGPDTTNGKVYAVAKDVFGNPLATSAANTFTIRNLGPVIQINLATQPWAGDVQSPFLVNGIHGNGYMGVQPTCYIDGMPNTGIENGYVFLTGGNVLAHTARYPNGIHDVHCLLATFASGVVATPSFTAAAVNVVTNTITLTTHPFLPGQSFVYTTSGTPITGLTPGITYYAAVIDPNTLKVASSSANATTCSASNTNCITLGGAGTGMHTFTYTFADPYYIASAQYTMPMSIYRAQVDFENTNAAMELRMPEEIVLYQDLGPITYTSAPFVANCDSSTTAIAANAPVYSSGNPAVFTVNSSGVVTAVGPGFADLTTTYSGLPPVVSHISVFSTTQFKHLSKSGQTLTTYTAGQSAWANSVFQIDHNYDALTPAMCREWQWSGDLSTEEAAVSVIVMHTPQTSYANAITNNWSPTFAQIQADATNCNHAMFWNFQAINQMTDTLAQYNNLGWSNAPGSTRLDADHKMMSDIIADGRTRMIYFGDEITNEWNSDPAPNPVVGGNQFNKIVVTGCPSIPCTGSAVVTYTTGIASTGGDSSWFKLTGCTTVNLCGPYVIKTPTVNSPTVSGYVTSFTITTHNVLNGQYDGTNNPAMKLIYWAYTGTGGGERYVVPGGQSGEVIQQRWNAGVSLDHIAITGASDPKTATVTWPACCGVDPAALATGRIVWGHSAAHAELNDAFTITRVDSNTVTFQIWGSTLTTYNVSTDPSFFFSVDGMTDENVIKNVKGSIFNVAGAPAISWPILGAIFIGGNLPNQLPIVANWENTPSIASASHKFSYNGPFQTYGDHSSPFEAITDKRTTAIGSRGYWMYPSIDLIIMIPIAYNHYAVSPCSVRFLPGVDLAGYIQLNPAAVTTQMAWVVAKSATVGKRAYHAGQDGATPATSDLCTKPAGAGFDQGPDPFTYWMPFWNAMALDNSLDNRLTKYIFQPMITSPGYGPYFFTGARGGVAGNILMIGSLSSMPRTQTIDFTSYRFAGGLIRRYRLTARGLSVQSFSGAATADTPTFAGGEVIYYVFQPAGGALETNTVQVTPPTSFPLGTSKMAIKIGYYHNLGDVDAIDCTSGCAPEMDLNVTDGWFQRIYLDGSNVVKTVGDQQVMSHH